VNPGRVAAFERLTRLAEAFPRLDPPREALPAMDGRDAALAHSIERLVVRRWLTLQPLLERQLTRPWERVEAGVRAALLGGAAQLFLMDRVPEHAAVAETVEWAKRSLRPGSSGMVNAVLRGLAGMRLERLDAAAVSGGKLDDRALLPLEDGGAWRLREPIFGDAAPDRLSQRSGVPLGLLLRWINRFGHANASDLAMHTLMPAPLVVHGLPAGLSGTAPIPGLDAVVWEGEHAGLVEAMGAHPGARVQDAASAMAVAMTAELRPAVIVDACAGRGTKSLQLAALHPQARVVASEPDADRRRSLHETAARGARAGIRVEVAEGEASRGLLGTADLLVLDVPCSNTGVLPRRAEAMHRFSPRSLDSLVQLQRRILEEHLPLLRPGGAILYATCSVEPEENERQIAWIAGRVRTATPRTERRMPEGLPGEPASRYRDGAFAALLTDVHPKGPTDGAAR